MIPQPPFPPHDARLPAVSSLLGPEARTIIEAGLQERLTDFGISQVRYSPGRSITASYAARDSGGSRVTATAHAGKRLPRNTSIVSDGVSDVAVWRFPQDPMLPGLAHVVRSAPLTPILAEIGIEQPIRDIRLRAYRPRRRAVVEVLTDSHRLFIKTVRPERVAGLQTTHKLAANHLRVPRSLGWSSELGIAILEALPGASLRHALDAGEIRLPSGTAIEAVLDQLPPIAGERPGLIARIGTHSRFLRTVVPNEASRLASMIEEIGTAPAEPLVAAHNDFHSAQVIVSDGTITGLVDIDTIGLGTRADDLAMMLGHLRTQSLTSKRSEALNEYAEHLQKDFETMVDPIGLRRRVAAAMVGFATSPFRTFRPDWQAEIVRRLDAVEAWLRPPD